MRGFVLPEGSAQRGEQVFVAMKCTACHRVDGLPALPAPTVAADRVVVIGGEVARVKTYGQLLTAIIHPSLDLSPKMPRELAQKSTVSPMPSVNDQLTVMQLIDIVTFLQPHYRKLEPLYEPYYTYPGL
jgi:mono/diheme cytochrome c family protein